MNHLEQFAAEPIRIAHLYPDLLNLYGDRGNLIALHQRLAWRGIDSIIEPIGLGTEYNPERYDLTFIGGGQDYEQSILYTDLINGKKAAIREAVDQERVFLCICGGFQLMGQYYQTNENQTIECLGIIDHHTEACPDRLIGDTIYESEMLTSKGLSGRLYGFENHSGRTFLGTGVQSLATVVKGRGNNGEDKTEGAVFKNVYCTYSHGSFLPKNPAMTDYLIITMLRRRQPDFTDLPALNDELENNARNALEQLG
ncbi:MAG: glutamine amidotransferase [Ruminococcaceae bacterium]|nr:glutamine amidotransferase [Oscillospiraceae bacterium]